MDDRYQNQPRHVQLYRWLRYVPFYTAWGVLAATHWLIFSRDIPICESENHRWPMYASTWDGYWGIVRLYRSLAASKTKHYYTMAEVFERIGK